VRSPVEGSSTKKNLNTGDLVATLAVTRRLDLTDEQWARLEPLLPVPTRSGRPLAWTKRQLIDGLPMRDARTSSLRQLVVQVPAPVVADALGFHQTTTTRQFAAAGGTWSRYAATRAAAPGPSRPAATSRKASQ
jgi:transposase